MAHAEARGSASRSRRAAAVLLAFSVGAVLYGCLYPFHFTVVTLEMPAWRGTSRGDLVANLLLYLPFGFLFAWLTAPHRSSRRVLAAAVAFGALLSFGVEILQSGIPSRTSSTADVLLNALGTALGVVAFYVFRRVSGGHAAGARLAAYLREPTIDPVIIMLGALWIALHTAPFVPHLDLQAMWAATRPLRALDISVPGVARHFAAYLILAACLRAMLVREAFWRTLFLVAAASLCARVLFVRQELSLNEPVGLLCALAVIAALRPMPHARAAGVKLVLVALAWLVQSLAPFTFGTTPGSFQWLPFIGFIGSGLENGYLSLVDKTFLYVGMLWLCKQSGRRIGVATVAIAAAALALEALQCFLPGRVADITDPLLVLLAGYVVSLSSHGFRQAHA